MPISNIPIFSMLRTRCNGIRSANACWRKTSPTPIRRNSRRAISSPPNFDQSSGAARSVTLARTNPGHFWPVRRPVPASQFQLDRKRRFRDRGHPAMRVSLEDEMLKVASNAMDYQAATALYTRGLGLIKTALGKR